MAGEIDVISMWFYSPLSLRRIYGTFSINDKNCVDDLRDEIKDYIETEKLKQICPYRYLLCMRLANIDGSSIIGEDLVILQNMISRKIKYAKHIGKCTIEILYTNGDFEKINIIELLHNTTPLLQYSSYDLKNISELFKKRLPSAETIEKKLSNGRVSTVPEGNGLLYKVEINGLYMEFISPIKINDKTVQRSVEWCKTEKDCIICDEKLGNNWICSKCGTFLCEKCFEKWKENCPICRDPIACNYFRQISK